MTKKNIWKHRFQDIRAFERHLTRNGTLVLKFHLRISKREQRKRFLARLDEPEKRWKFSAGDIAERAYWDDYMAAYEEMIRETSTDYAPWYVIPADHKHVAWVTVSAAIVEAIEALKPSFPKISGEALKDLKKAERALRAEGDRQTEIKIGHSITAIRPGRIAIRRVRTNRRRSGENRPVIHTTQRTTIPRVERRNNVEPVLSAEFENVTALGPGQPVIELIHLAREVLGNHTATYAVDRSAVWTGRSTATESKI